MTALSLEGVGFARPAVRGEGRPFALHVDRLELRPGSATGIVGPSGCGKSTLVDLLALLRRPTACRRFELMGHDVAALWQRDARAACTHLRARHVGVVLQTGALIPSLSLIENVRLVQRLLGRLEDDWTDQLLDTLGLADLRRRLPAQLSIGQRQRAAIARALAHRPAVVLADEPTASLGVDHAPAAMALLVSLAREGGAALLVVSHDADLLRAHGVTLRHAATHDDGVHFDAPAAAMAVAVAESAA